MPAAILNGIGSVVSLWRYPVKSMLGEELNSAEFTERGLLGDRVYALIDASNGKVVSHKNPKKWPKLFDFRAAFVHPPRGGEKIPAVRLTLPDGTTITSEQSEVGGILSKVLGREVSFGAVAPKAPSLEEFWPDTEGLAHREKVTDELMLAETFFDCAAVHLLTTATLDRLRQLYPQGRFEVRRFRPNIVVASVSGPKDFVENAWEGQTIVIGGQVRLRIAGPCQRCVMTTLPQADLPHDPGILRAAAQHNRANVGVYAEVLQGGTVRRGDPVRFA